MTSKRLKIAFLFIFLLFTINLTFSQNLKQYPRVRTAYKEKQDSILKRLKELGINNLTINTLIVVYKSEHILQVWVKKPDSTKFLLYKEFPICYFSGKPGPKRKQGDLQVPEGFYHIWHYNPVSNFYLSLGINYPNKSDKILGDKNKPGGQIYIHGNCVSIGCIAITDNLIKEVFVLAYQSKLNGYTVPVYIFPFKMTDENFKKYSTKYPKYQSFWSNLKQGYDLWNKNHKKLKFKIDQKGQYVFLDAP